MISLENTKTVYDLVKNTGKEYGSKVYMRYEENDVIYEKTYKEFTTDCIAVAAWTEEKNKNEGHKVHTALLGRCSYDYLAVLLGTVSAGSVAVPLDVQLSKEGLCDCIERSDIDIVFYDWEFNSQIEVIATTIITIGETRPAVTAASPNTSAPTILMAAPATLGDLTSASLNISKMIMNINTSINVGKGT